MRCGPPLLALCVLTACGDDAAGDSSDTGGTTDETATGRSTSSPTQATSAATTQSAADSDGSDTAPVSDLPPVVQCGPSADGPYWLLEGETVGFDVGCSTDVVLPGSAFSFPDLPEGASYDPSTSTFTWTTGLSDGAVYDLEIVEDTYGETGVVRIGVADAFMDPANVPVVDPAAYTHEYGLPVVHLNNNDELNNDYYTAATLVHDGHLYTAESKLRGASSLGYPKNNYTLKFEKEDKFSDDFGDDGLVERRKLVLTSTFDDNSYIRQRLAFEMWNRLDPEHIQVRAYNVILFRDGAYHGLYVLGDHIDGYLMEDHDLWQDGNLYKARSHDANFANTNNGGSPKSTLHDGLTKSEGIPPEGEPGAFDDLDELVDFVANSNQQTFVAELDSRIDQRDYEDWFIFASAISASDSGAKNSYHYHNPAEGKWRCVPWDFNESFGQDWRTLRVGADQPFSDYFNRNFLFERIYSDPLLGSALMDRYDTVLTSQYALDDLLALIDTWTAENHPSALRDESRWSGEYQTYGGWNWRDDFLTHEQEVEYVKTWLTERWLFLGA